MKTIQAFFATIASLSFMLASLGCSDGTLVVDSTSGTVDNPFGLISAQVEAEALGLGVTSFKLWTENTPPGVYVKFEPAQVNFSGRIHSTMTIYGRTAPAGTYTFQILAEWTNALQQRWRGESSYTLTVTNNYEIEALPSWTQNPTLEKTIGLWETRTFCWSILGGDCPINPSPNSVQWIDDGEITLYSEDDNTMDFGVNCSALTQGVDKVDPSRVYGTSLERIRNGDVRKAFILFKRSDFGTSDSSLIGGLGTIINIWLTGPAGENFGIDFYFETQGMNNWYFIDGERPWQHSEDTAVYSLHIKTHPEYWTKSVKTDGSEYWTIDLKKILERAENFTNWNLDEFEWRYIEPITESFAVGVSQAGSAWQSIHYFDVKVDLD